MPNTIVEMSDGETPFKSLLIQEKSENIRLRNIFHVNEIMGGNYWLLDAKNTTKFKLNINQVKVLKIAMAMVNPKESIDETKPPISYTFTIDKLLDIMGYTNQRLKYIDLPNFLNDLMKNDNFSYRDEKGNLHLLHIFDRVIYKPEKQEVTFRFSWSMLEKFLIIENKEDSTYQSYVIGNIMGFKSLYSINLYELFKVKLKGQKQRSFEIDITDLKVALDLYNPDEPQAEKYIRYYDFKKNVLQESIDEINNAKDIDIEVSYIERKSRKTVTSIIFKIINLKNNFKKKDKNKDKPKDNELAFDENTSQNKDTIINIMKSIILEDLKDKDLLSIYFEAKGNKDIIKEKYDLMKKQDTVANITGWMIDAIKYNYTKKEHKQNKDYNSEQQGRYNFDKLEAEFESALAEKYD